MTGPNANRITTYSLPISAVPYMVAVGDGQIWYTAQGVEAGSVGILDPSLVSGSISQKKPTSGFLGDLPHAGEGPSPGSPPCWGP